MDRKIKCEYLNDENLCRAVIENEDGKAVRKDSCANESLEACCYFCKSRSSCDISCNYLGDQMVVRTEIQMEKVKRSQKKNIFKSLMANTLEGILPSPKDKAYV